MKRIPKNFFLVFFLALSFACAPTTEDEEENTSSIPLSSDPQDEVDTDQPFTDSSEEPNQDLQNTVFVNNLPTNNKLSPWDTEDYADIFEGHEFQADSQGTGAKNWTATRYVTEPIRNGSNIQALAFANEQYIYQICPSGDGVRRTEFRDRTDRNLNDAHRMQFNCQLINVETEEKIIFAQLHNDHTDSKRPYLTAFLEEGNIYIERTNNPSGTGSSRHAHTLDFDESHSYQVLFETRTESTDISATLTDLETEQSIYNTWSMPTEWTPLNGEFYFKFGCYMPNGGSTETTSRVDHLEIE